MKRNDFIQWTKKYFLPNGQIDCDAIDLYAARCAVLHGLKADSSLSRQRKAKQLIYSWGNNDPNSANDLLRRIRMDHTVMVHIDTLFEALQMGVGDFLLEVSADRKREALVLRRAREMFKHQDTFP